MTQIIRQLIGMLERLPESIQDRYGNRWMQELIEEQGEGATQAPMLDESRQVTYDDIKHLLGVFEGGPSDLSYNPEYMEGFGED